MADSRESTPPNTPKHDAVDNTKIQIASESLHPFTGIQIDELDKLHVEQQNHRISSDSASLHPLAGSLIDEPTQVEQQSSSQPQTHVDSKNPVLGYAPVSYKCPRCKEIVQTAVSTRPNAFLWGVSGLIFLIGLMLAIFGTFVSTLIGILLMVASIALIIAVAVDVWTGFKMFQNVHHQCPGCHHKIGTHSIIGTELNVNVANC